MDDETEQKRLGYALALFFILAWGGVIVLGYVAAWAIDRWIM